MIDLLERTKPYAPAIVRIGMSLVFVAFGIWQLADPGPWASYVPDYAAAAFGGNAAIVVALNGWFETVAGLMLIVGLQTRTIGLLLGLHLLLISQSLGLSQIGIRDIGLTIATLSIFIAGPDRLCLDRLLTMRSRSPIAS